MSKKRLRPYQREALNFLLSTGIGGCLFMEMRLGKTLTAIRYCIRLLWENPKGKILIVAPFSAFRGWILDLAEEKQRLVVVEGSAEDKEGALHLFANFYLVNKEGLVKGKRVKKKVTPAQRKKWRKPGKRQKKIKTITEWKPIEGITQEEGNWLCVIIDESHYIKNPQSGFSKFMLKHYKDTPYKLCLTGTPFEENELDFLQQFNFVLGRKMVHDYWKFKAVFTKTYGYNLVLLERGRQALDKISKSLAFSLRRKEAGLDKEKVFEIYSLQLPAEIQKIYNKVVEEWVYEYQEERRLTKHIVEQFSILRRLCGGFAPGPIDENGERGEPIFVSNFRIKALTELIEDNFKGEPIIVFANYKAEIAEIKRHLEKRGHRVGVMNGSVPTGKPRWDLEAQFEQRKFDVFVVQPTTVREGMDLSTASTSIYYSIPSGYINWKQTQDRILNLKKDGSLLLIVMEVENSVEMNLWKKVGNKASREEILLSLLYEQSHPNKKIDK